MKILIRHIIVLPAVIALLPPSIAKPQTQKYVWTPESYAAHFDSADGYYQTKKRESIRRFGSQCEVGWYGTPISVSDTTLMRGITTKGDTEIAWQFLELHKDLFDIEDPRSELELKYAGPSQDKVFRLVFFDQHVNGIPVSRGAFHFYFGKDGCLQSLKSEYYPEAKRIDLESCISKEKSILIALADTVYVDKEGGSIWGRPHDEIYCFRGRCHYRWIVGVLDSSILQYLTIDGQTGEIVDVHYII